MCTGQKFSPFPTPRCKGSSIECVPAGILLVLHLVATVILLTDHKILAHYNRLKVMHSVRIKKKNGSSGQSFGTMTFRTLKNHCEAKRFRSI